MEMDLSKLFAAVLSEASNRTSNRTSKRQARIKQREVEMLTVNVFDAYVERYNLGNVIEDFDSDFIEYMKTFSAPKRYLDAELESMCREFIDELYFMCEKMNGHVEDEFDRKLADWELFDSYGHGIFFGS